MTSSEEKRQRKATHGNARQCTLALQRTAEKRALDTGAHARGQAYPGLAGRSQCRTHRRVRAAARAPPAAPPGRWPVNVLRLALRPAVATGSGEGASRLAVSAVAGAASRSTAGGTVTWAYRTRSTGRHKRAGVFVCTTHKTFTKGRSIFSCSTENGPALPQSSRVQPRSQEKCWPSWGGGHNKSPLEQARLTRTHRHDDGVKGNSVKGQQPWAVLTFAQLAHHCGFERAAADVFCPAASCGRPQDAACLHSPRVRPHSARPF